jgi:hypothetical protein
MAKTQTYPAVPETAGQVDPEATYIVRVSEPVPVGRRRLAVSLEHELSGEFLKTIWEKVSDVRKNAG